MNLLQLTELSSHQLFPDDVSPDLIMIITIRTTQITEITLYFEIWFMMRQPKLYFVLNTVIACMLTKITWATQT